MGKVDIVITVAGDPNYLRITNGVISGSVQLNVHKRISIKRLTLLLKGKSKCQWTSGSQDNRTTHTSKEILVNLGLDMLGNQQRIYEPGSHRLPYTFNLHNTYTLPSSFYNPLYGKIKYSLRVIMDKAGDFFDKKIQLPLNIVNPQICVNLPQYMEPVGYDDEVTDCCCWCAEGPIVMKAKLDKTGYVYGENIVVHLEIDNHSSNTMRPKIELHQREDFKTRGSKRNSTRVTAGISTQEKIKANTRHNTLVLTLPMNMAKTVPTLQTSNISISHWVKVRVWSMKFNVPITIGRH